MRFRAIPWILAIGAGALWAQEDPKNQSRERVAEEKVIITPGRFFKVEPQAGGPGATAQGQDKPTKRRSERSEDIRILSRLIEKEIDKKTHRPGSALWEPWVDQGLALKAMENVVVMGKSSSGNISGTYLKDYGVVIDLRLATKVERKKADKPEEPLSEWEKTRRELRGERSVLPGSDPKRSAEELLKKAEREVNPAPKPPPPPGAPGMAIVRGHDWIVRSYYQGASIPRSDAIELVKEALASNARNLRHVADDDWVAVRISSGAPASAGSGTWSVPSASDEDVTTIRVKMRHVNAGLSKEELLQKFEVVSED